MWLLACGMNRSGSTLQYQIAVKIAQTQPKVELVGWVSPADTKTILGNASDSEDTWYLAKLHDYDDEVEKFWQKFHPKAIYIYRDIRDVVVSLINRHGWSLDSQEMGYAIYFAVSNYTYWTQKPGILISRYEDVMAAGGLVAEVEKIAQYMDVELSKTEVEQIAASVSIDENKRYIETFDYQSKGIAHINSRFDPSSLFHDNHIHSGETEQWRTALTPEQIATVESWTGAWLKERGYSIEPPTTQQQTKALLNSLHSLEQIIALKAQVDQNAAQIAQYEGQVAQYEAQLAALRSRKIVRLMEKIGRPLL